MVKSIPEGFHSLTPFFMSNQPSELVDFMINGLGAEEVSILRQDNDKVWHAQLRIGNSMLMVGDSMGKTEIPMALYIYSDDADAAYKKAIAAGAESIMEPADQFYGDRNAGVKDKFGNVWWFATHIEDVSETEMRKRAQGFAKKAA